MPAVRPADATGPCDRAVRPGGLRPRRPHTEGRTPKGANRRPHTEGLTRRPQTEAAFFASDDLRFAAWFLWMTPLLTALSSLRDAARSAEAAFSASPDSTAVRTVRARVRSSLLTALLRSVRLA